MKMETLKLRCDTTQFRTLFVKEHQTTNTDAHSTAVFVAGLPRPLANESSLETLFGVYGEITTIALHPSKRSCIVVFVDKESKDQVLLDARQDQVLNWKGPLPKTGINNWLQEHKSQFPGDDVLQKDIDDWIIEFEKEERRKTKASKDNVADDGWVVVGRKKRKGIALEGNDPNGDTHTSVKKMKDHSDLYRISQKQNRIEVALSLRERFEEDKKRIAAYRAKQDLKQSKLQIRSFILPKTLLSELQQLESVSNLHQLLTL